MQQSIRFSSRDIVFSMLLVAVAMWTGVAHAASGTWTQTTSGGLWSVGGNWSGGTIADGSGFTAFFDTLNITADNTVHLNGDRTLTNLTFGDTNTGSAAGWILDNNGTAANNLILAGATPTITVNPLAAGKTVDISAIIEGTVGMTKNGDGTLILTGNNTYEGNTIVNGGTMQIAGSNGKLAAKPPTVNNGATFILGDTTTAANYNKSQRMDFGRLFLNGSTFQMAAPAVGFTHSEKTNALQIGAGFSEINSNAVGGTNWISFGVFGGNNYVRAVGGLVNFATDTGINVSFINAPTGHATGTGADAILLGATLNNTDFVLAANDAHGANIAPATYTPTSTNTWTAGKNMDVTGSNGIAYTQAAVNSVRFNANAANTVTLATGTNTIGGGILVTNNVGNNLSTITGGTIRADSGQDLLIVQNNTGNSLEIASVISNNSGSSLTKFGPGTLILSGANAYRGVTRVSAGTLSIDSIKDVGGGTSSVGEATTVANGTITIGSTTTAAALVYTGAGDTTDRVIDLAGTTGGATLDQSGTGLLKFTSDLAATGAGSKTLTLQGSTAGTSELSGAIVNGSGTTSVAKNGSGSWTLSGASTYTGTTTVNDGVLEISSTGSMAATAPLTVNGGTLSLKNDLTTDKPQGAGGTIQLSGGKTLTINQTSNGIFDGDITGSGNLVKGGVAGGHLRLRGTLSYDGFTTVGGTGFTVLVLQSATTTLPATTVLTVNSSGQVDLTAGTGNKTVEIAGLMGDGTIYSHVSTGTLKINTPTSTNYAYSGILKPQAGGDIILVKDGAGTQTLSGVNTYTGATQVLDGTLIVASGNINATSDISVSAGANFIYNSGTSLTKAVSLAGAGLGDRAVLGGSGSIDVAITLDDLGDVLSPGNSAGTLPFGTSQSWASYSYDWEINDFTGTSPGTDFDLIAITGSLDLSGGPGSYQLNLLSLLNDNSTAGDVENFSEIASSWTILTTTTGITGFDAANWAIDATGFSSSPAHQGTFSIAKQDDNLVLQYQPLLIPEPATFALLGLALAGLLIFARKRSK